MTGEMHPSEVTPENWPQHFAVAQEYGGTVEPFDQYQGPYVLLYDGENAGSRFFIYTDDGVYGHWWNESTDKYSPAGFCASDSPEDIADAVDAFRDLIENGGVDDPSAGLIIDQDGTLALTMSLASYVSGDDATLPREEFLRMVADRIMSDLPARNEPLIVDGTTMEGGEETAGDGQFPPFFIFDPNKQRNIEGPFETRETAETRRKELMR